jgi:hypothetical protein
MPAGGFLCCCNPWIDRLDLTNSNEPTYIDR